MQEIGIFKNKHCKRVFFKPVTYSWILVFSYKHHIDNRFKSFSQSIMRFSQSFMRFSQSIMRFSQSIMRFSQSIMRFFQSIKLLDLIDFKVS